jgi:hypothetical protein
VEPGSIGVDGDASAIQEVKEQLNDDYGEVLAPEQIPSSQDITNAQQEGQTIFQLEQPSQTAQHAIAAYQENARTLIGRTPALTEAETGPEAIDRSEVAQLAARPGFQEPDPELVEMWREAVGNAARQL